jgi:hypothetical protein
MEPLPTIQIDRRESERRAKFNEPVSLKVFITVLSAVIVAALLWLSSTAGSAVVTTTRFERDSTRRDFRDSMRSRDIQEIRADIKCVRAIVAKSVTVAEVCR